MTQQSEFSRRVPLNRIGNGFEDTVEATAAEREALVKRFGLVSLESLSCRFRITSVSSKVFLGEGWLAASVHQKCVITDDVFPDALTEAFTVRFIPEEEMPEDEFDIDSIDLDAIDDVSHDGRGLDLGEAAAEQLALMLDPYPRRPGVGLEDAVDVAPSETEAENVSDARDQEKSGKPHPFAALAALRDAKKGN